MRYSHQRELILKEVGRRQDYPTAEQICTSLRSECPRLSLGTVYRDLNTLVEVGMIRRVSIPGKADCFDGRTDIHENFYCRTCGRVLGFSVPADQMRKILDGGSENQVEDYMLTVFGTCKECSKKVKRD